MEHRQDVLGGWAIRFPHGVGFAQEFPLLLCLRCRLGVAKGQHADFCTRGGGPDSKLAPRSIFQRHEPDGLEALASPLHGPEGPEQAGHILRGEVHSQVLTDVRCHQRVRPRGRAPRCSVEFRDCGEAGHKRQQVPAFECLLHHLPEGADSIFVSEALDRLHHGPLEGGLPRDKCKDLGGLLGAHDGLVGSGRRGGGPVVRSAVTECDAACTLHQAALLLQLDEELAEVSEELVLLAPGGVGSLPRGRGEAACDPLAGGARCGQCQVAEGARRARWGQLFLATGLQVNWVGHSFAFACPGGRRGGSAAGGLLCWAAGAAASLPGGADWFVAPSFGQRLDLGGWGCLGLGFLSGGLGHVIVGPGDGLQVLGKPIRGAVGLEDSAIAEEEALIVKVLSDVIRREPHVDRRGFPGSVDWAGRRWPAPRWLSGGDLGRWDEGPGGHRCWCLGLAGGRAEGLLCHGLILCSEGR